MSYTFHPMTIGDYDETYALWSAIPGIGLSAADSRENTAAYLARNPGQSFVCRADGVIVGAILCGNDGRRAYIHHAAVAPEYRLNGVAAELVRMALDAQYALGISKCHLFIFSENQSGQAFWRRMGFEPRHDISVMSREI